MKKEFLEYIRNCYKADELNQQIQELEVDIAKIEKVLEVANGIKSIEDTVGKELRNLKIKKSSLEIEFDLVDLKIKQFEMAEELRD